MKDLLRKKIIVSKWDFLSLSLLILSLLLQAIRLPFFPLFIDIYYHLAVMLGFNQAGGYATHVFWEAAPFGYPHFYPPLLHIAMLLLYKLGLSKIAIAKILDFLLYPSFLLAAWLIFRRVISERFAFFALLVASSAYSFYLSFVNNHAASLALIICLCTFYCLTRGRTIASAMLFGLCFYIHLGMGGLFVAVFFLYGLFNRQNLKICLKMISGGVIIALPLLLYVYHLKGSFTFYGSMENYLLEINLLIYIGAILGLSFFLKKKKEYYFFLSCVLGMLPLIIAYRFRYLSFQGLLGIIFLCSIFIDELYSSISGRFARVIFIIGTSFIFLFVSPVIEIDNANISINIWGSNLSKQLVSLKNSFQQEKYYKDKLDVRNSKIYDEASLSDILKIIKEHSDKDDIIYANFRYAAGALGVFSERSVSTVMLQEVKSEVNFDPIAYAKVIVLFREEDGTLNLRSTHLAEKYKLTHISDTELASVYLNPQPKGRRVIVKALIPAFLLFVMLSAYVILLVSFI